MIPQVDPKQKAIFGGHESFVLRHGWLKKGVDAAKNDPTIFSDEQALVTLGVGKNMVRSIRHWCLAMKLVKVTPGEKRALTVTSLGERLLLDGGWDPFLEDTASLWLIHWLLCTNRERALVWDVVLSRLYESEFSKASLASFLGRQLERMKVHTTSGTIQREVDCFLRTYALTSRSRADGLSEETLECPLTELDLIRYNKDDGVYLFNVGPKPSLPAELFGYSLLDFLPTIAQNRRTVGVEECLYHEGSPGLIFRLDENSLVAYLEEVGRLTDGQIQLEETAGLRQVYLHTPVDHGLETLKMDLLNRYYAHQS